MNTNQFWNPYIQNKRNICNMNDWKHWIPITLSSYINVSNEKNSQNYFLNKRIENLEYQLDEMKVIQENIKNIYFKRIYDLKQIEFYNESPNWNENKNIINMVDTLSWISYNNKEKKQLLDNDIINFMNINI